MIDGELKVFIRKDDCCDEVNIFFVIKNNQGKRLFAKPVKLEFCEREEGTFVEPTLSFFGRSADEIMMAFAKELDSHGIKLENEHKVYGLYEASQKHLSDLRKLLKLK